MLQILSRLTAIKGFAKDIHYTAKGESFYGVHLLMDRVADGIDGFMDSINEVVYLGGDNTPPPSREVLKYASAYVPSIGETIEGNLSLLYNLIAQALQEVESYQTTERSVASLLDSIAQDLRLKKGLVSRSMR